MLLDLKSIAATVILLELVIGFITIVAGRRYKSEDPSLRYWGYITIVQGINWIIFHLGDYTPLQIHRSVAPFLLIMTLWGYSFILRRFLNKRPHHRIFIPLLALLFLSQIFFVYIFPNEIFRVITVALIVPVFAAELVYVMVRRNPEYHLASHRLMAGVFALIFTLYALRLVYFVHASQNQGRFFIAFDLAQSITMLWIGTCFVAASYAFMLMNNDRYFELRRHAELERENAEQEFRLVRDNVPVMIWKLNKQGDILWLNKAWLNFTGENLENARRADWLDRIHSDDRDRVRATVGTSLRDSLPYHIEYRLRRRDGLYCWVLETGFPIHGDDGSISGYTGSTIDLTEHKLQQEQIEALSAEVMRISETERAEIAAELHDSLGQNLVLTSLRLQASLANFPEVSAEEKKSILEPVSNSLKAAREISHRLVPAHLESIGLKMAIDDLLQNVAETGKFIVHAETEALASIFPGGWNMDLYRIMQEALTNIIKHAGADEIRLLTERTISGLLVTITDNGTKNSGERKAQQGIGLMIMRERARKFGGRVDFLHADSGFAVRISIPGQFEPVDAGEHA